MCACVYIRIASVLCTVNALVWSVECAVSAGGFTVHVGLEELLNIRTSRRFIAGRLTSDMETKLNFLTSKV